MLTAANRTTKKSQEIIATDNGELMVALEECQAQSMTSNGTISSGACRLAGVVLIAGSDAASVTVESDSETKLKLKAAANTSCSVMLPMPVYCLADLSVTLTGTSPQAIVYYSSV